MITSHQLFPSVAYLSSWSFGGRLGQSTNVELIIIIITTTVVIIDPTTLFVRLDCHSCVGLIPLPPTTTTTTTCQTHRPPTNTCPFRTAMFCVYQLTRLVLGSSMGAN